MGYALSDAPPLAYFVLNTYLDPPPPSRSPMGIACLVYVWVVWEKNFTLIAGKKKRVIRNQVLVGLSIYSV